MKIADFTLFGLVFGGCAVLGYKLMQALEESGFIDLKELGLRDE